MGKKLGVLLLIVSLLLAIVACNSEQTPEEPAAETLVRVTLSAQKGTAKALTAINNFNVDEITTWKYTATKKDDGATTGQSAEPVALENGQTQPLSLGTWSFTLYGYKADKLICSGPIAEVSVSESAKTFSIPVKELQAGTGIITIGTLTLVDNTGASFSAMGGIQEVKLYKDEKDITEQIKSGSVTVASGTYKVVVIYKKGSLILKGEKDIEVYDGLVTTLSGSLERTIVVGAPDLGGGYIFYDVDADNAEEENDGLTSAELGWRYLQAATTDIKIVKWGPAGSSLSTETGIGTGYANTKKIYDANSTNSSYMAVRVWNQTIDDGNGWFIPSKDELTLLYNNLYLNGIGALTTDGNYWSSSEYVADSSVYFIYQWFGCSKQYAAGAGETAIVRPVRYLTASGDVYIPNESETSTVKAGPGGGLVFYDVDADNAEAENDGLTSAELGWRYLQVATSDIENVAWGERSADLGTATEIGTGYFNTKKIFEATTGYANAATEIWNQTIDGGTGWFIPSKDELALVYEKLCKKGLGSLVSTGTASEDYCYWSSSEYDTMNGWFQGFNNGTPDAANRGASFKVRPVRYLTSNFEVFVPISEPSAPYIFYDVDADNVGDEAGEDGLKSSECGWRYLQAATTDIKIVEWGPAGSSLSTETGIGTGYANTKKIYAANSTDSTYMAVRVWNQTIDDGNGWFIPSKDELNLLYNNLYRNGKGGLTTGGNYWSSSEYVADSSVYFIYQWFGGGDQNAAGAGNTAIVRPVRYLTASGDVYIPNESETSTVKAGPGGGLVFYDVDADNAEAENDGLTSAELGWRYLQVATSDIEAVRWGQHNMDLGTATEVGSGYANTKKIFEATTGYANAATEIWNQTIDGGTGWFIPSKDELALVYDKLCKKGLGSLVSTGTASEDYCYWSSSEYDTNQGWFQGFNNGIADAAKRGRASFKVRPVRYLTSNYEVFVPTV